MKPCKQFKSIGLILTACYKKNSCKICQYTVQGLPIKVLWKRLKIFLWIECIEIARQRGKKIDIFSRIRASFFFNIHTGLCVWDLIWPRSPYEHSHHTLAPCLCSSIRILVHLHCRIVWCLLCARGELLQKIV